MSELAELLEVLHGAGESFRTFRGVFDAWERPDVAHRALRSTFEHGPRRVRVGQRRAGIVGFNAPLGDADSVDEEALDPEESVVRVWLERPDRYREEQGEGEGMERVVRDGERWWSYDDHFGPQTNEGEGAEMRSSVGGQFESLLDPADLMALLRFESLGRGRRVGREVLRARARPRSVGAGRDHALGALGVGADEYELDVDAERGVILRVVARLNGEDFFIAEARELAYDETLPADTFVFESPDHEAPVPESEREWVPRRVPIHEAARLAPFEVFALAGMPEPWAVFALFSAERKRPPQPPEVALMYVSGGSAGTVTVTERAAGQSDRRRRRGPDAVVTREVTRDGLTLQVTESGTEFATVSLVRDGTEIELASGDVSTDQLIELVSRLRPAPDEAPEI